jgi:hypothetical protein
MMKLIERIAVLTLLVGVVGSLAILGYFWHKSGQPMQVAEAQAMVPGITFREFWASRVEQWEAWDDELRAVGRNGSCVETGTTMFVLRAITSGPFVADLRNHRFDEEFIRKLVDANNGVVPPENLLYNNSFFEAWWATIEEINWWAYADYPGGFPVKELNQRHACSTTYPTPKKSGN